MKKTMQNIIIFVLTMAAIVLSGYGIRLGFDVDLTADEEVTEPVAKVAGDPEPQEETTTAAQEPEPDAPEPEPDEPVDEPQSQEQDIEQAEINIDEVETTEEETNA